MMSDWKQIACLLKHCAHPVRLQILDQLRDGPACVQETMIKLESVSQPNLSQHLLALKSAGLIDCRKRGAQRCYFLCRPTLVVGLLDLLSREHEYFECKQLNENNHP